LSENTHYLPLLSIPIHIQVQTRGKVVLQFLFVDFPNREVPHKLNKRCLSDYFLPHGISTTTQILFQLVGNRHLDSCFRDHILAKTIELHEREESNFAKKKELSHVRGLLLQQIELYLLFGA